MIKSSLIMNKNQTHVSQTKVSIVPYWELSLFLPFFGKKERKTKKRGRTRRGQPIEDSKGDKHDVQVDVVDPKIFPYLGFILLRFLEKCILK